MKKERKKRREKERKERKKERERERERIWFVSERAVTPHLVVHRRW